MLQRIVITLAVVDGGSAEVSRSPAMANTPAGPPGKGAQEARPSPSGQTLGKEKAIKGKERRDGASEGVANAVSGSGTSQTNTQAAAGSLQQQTGSSSPAGSSSGRRDASSRQQVTDQGSAGQTKHAGERSDEHPV